jgi:spermidine synthase
MWATAALACARPPVRPVAVNTSHAPPIDGHVLFDQISPFGRVLVMDEGILRVMRFGSLQASQQSAIVPGQPGAVPIEYIRYALLGLAYHGGPGHILMIGLGGGTFSTFVHHALPGATVDVVEIDPVVVTAARAYFGLREDERYRVHVANAAEWIARDNGSYDYILLDAYAGEEIPRLLAAQPFFKDVARRLAPGGVVAINIAQSEAEGMAVARAFHAVFTPFDCRRTPADGNIVIFAGLGPRVVDTVQVQRWLTDWDARGVSDFSLRALAGSLDRRAAGSDCASLLQAAAPGDGASPLWH